MELRGKYNTAEVFTDIIDNGTISQIIELLNQEFIKDSKVRIMPDCHQGKGCVIGTTISITDKVVPNLVGSDIGCGVLCVELGNTDINLEELDNYITNNIPSGFSINQTPLIDYSKELNKLYCINDLNKSIQFFNQSLGSLGGGNHFIEVDQDDEGTKYLIIHTGSRNLGTQVALYYQNLGYITLNSIKKEYEEKSNELIKEYKSKDKEKELESALTNLAESIKYIPKIPKDLSYIEGDNLQKYLHDMDIVQKYSVKNREIISSKIVEFLNLNYKDLHKFESIHNYIDLENSILRKGAISAQKDEDLLIPINMKDGVIIGRGKGNPEWNYSAPHGAGRLLSRSQAKEHINLAEYQDLMKGIYSTSINTSTIDEAPQAYKPIDEIINNIQDTVDIIKIVKPIYNFKSSDSK